MALHLKDPYRYGYSAWLRHRQYWPNSDRNLKSAEDLDGHDHVKHLKQKHT